MKYKPIIIGIAGAKQSGKTTVASMINYMLTNGLAKADYYIWRNVQEHYINKDVVINFADRLKDICSEIFNIPRDAFDSTHYKDECVYSITLCKFIKRDKLNADYHHEITINDLRKNNLNLMVTRIKFNSDTKANVISLRTIMQYIGTEIYRNLISDTIWVDLTIAKANKIADYGYCIIGDVRFRNEADAIRHSLYGGTIIKLVRDTGRNDSHESEIIDVKEDYLIENNSNLMSLFYKVLTILKEIVL